MPYNDWLAEPDRHTEASERIYAAAAQLIARDGFDAFTVQALAARSTAHLPPSTATQAAKPPSAIPCWPRSRTGSSGHCGEASTAWRARTG